MEKIQSYKKLNSNALKLIAIVAMTIDHIAWQIFPGFSREPVAVIMHLIGRITCPVMCYCIAEGFHYTRNVKKYTARLFLLALVSHVPYMLNSFDYTDWTSLIPFYNGNFFNQTSVVWSLAWGLVMLRAYYSEKLSNLAKTLVVVGVCVITFPSDWSCIAAMCVLCIGSNRNQPKKQLCWCLFYVSLYVLVYCLALDWLYGLVQFGVLLSVPLIVCYNGKRGANPIVNKIMKWLFYIYYPLHLMILALIFVL